ncbi:hypothetical protein NFHSH190041_03560 [Shewanella sp. NFH-SH190041]|uniref:hypothetical protein n=1 Tax=Shewanella sp. NFH-SH190041 TaxID=2950245 RepID=UPI0021C48FFE|nr:hypothetical protein [Shewanella sp. NFH-SH190041]BDM62904.1 hypothetical protein NFHSH190041_03560 [Shewanella sp. NFH-SH190041]
MTHPWQAEAFLPEIELRFRAAQYITKTGTRVSQARSSGQLRQNAHFPVNTNQALSSVCLY